ncbi:MAG TPA: 4Fe-4S binding protein [Phycisphaerae bacterium]|nr:4Fe-4S binding protein [Phycisphaerae bacterium]
MRIAIASGKGGTGKTLVATNLAAALRGATYLDCDVEGANGHLFLKPAIRIQRPAEVSVPVATDACTGCGACAEACRFGAIASLETGPVVFNELCHSCGACLEACPQGALNEVPHALGKIRIGDYRIADAPPAPFADGELNTGQVRAAAVIEQVKDEADPDTPVTVLDCPPGAGCAVAEALRGADLCLLVTEPTPFGLSDLDKAIGLADYLGIPQAVILNRSDLGGADARAFCAERNLPIVLEIPYDAELARLYAEGQLVYTRIPRYREIFDALADAIRSGLFERRTPPAERQALPLFADGVEPDTTRCTEVQRPAGLVQVAVISGKGGTGKTSLAASLAAMADSLVTADADVDAANLHLLLGAHGETRIPFSAGYLAQIDPDNCRGCGVCANECRFEAISLTPHAEVDPLRCIGCGLCALVCPLQDTGEMPVRLVPRLSGYAYSGETDRGGEARGELLAGGEASGKLVTLVRNLAETRTVQTHAARILIDAPPGMGCPVNAALTGTDLAVAVTEPTQSGLHDLNRALDLAAWFKVPTLVVINKADICPEMAASIREACAARGLEVIGAVPFDRSVPEDVAAGRVPAFGKGPGAAALRDVCRAVLKRLPGPAEANAAEANVPGTLPRSRP